MRVLTRYLLRAHLGPFLFAFLALTGVILINTLARQLAELAGKGLEMGVILHFFVLSLPSNIALTLPMAVLVSVLYTFSQMASENEITALKASGIDLRRMIMPLLFVAGLIALGMTWFNDRVLPESNHQWRQLMVDIGQKSPVLTLREQVVNPIRAGDGFSRYYLQAAKIDPTTNLMRNVVIYDVSEPRMGRTIYADSGWMAFNETRTDLFITLFDGHLREVNFDEPANFQRLDFRQQVMRMPGVGNELQRTTGSAYRGDREMTIGMLQARIDTLRTELAAIHENAALIAQTDLAFALGEEPENLPPPSSGVSLRPVDGDPVYSARRTADNLRSTHERRLGIERQIREFHVEVQKKYSIAAATLVFVLIGAPVALRFGRGGVGMVIAVSLGIFGIYYVGLIGGETLADEGYVHPVIAMWSANALLGVLGIIGVIRMGREMGSQRGEGWWERMGGYLGELRLVRRFRRTPEGQG